MRWWCLCLLAGCGVLVEDANRTRLLDLDDPACAGTHEGRACVTFVFGAKQGVIDDAPGDLRGPFEWAVYKGGDVDISGPGDNEKLFGTPGPHPPRDVLPYVDFSSQELRYVVTLPDIPARDYQVIAYLDDDEDGEPTVDDPVTYPRDPFYVDADAHTEVRALCDALKPGF